MVAAATVTATRLKVKRSPATEQVLDRQRQALLTLNPSMRLYEPGCGGGNAQVFIRF